MKPFFVSLTLMAAGSLAFAKSFDGCYHLFGNESLSVVLCLSGTTEEGISGAGARLALFGPNSYKFLSCYHSSALKMTEDSVSFYFHGARQVTLQVTNEAQNGTLYGVARFFSTERKFAELKGQLADELLSYTARCQPVDEAPTEE